MTNSKESTTKEEGHRSSTRSSSSSSKKAFPTKIVCRRLPPTLDKDTFLELVTPLPEYNYFRFEKPNSEDGSVSFCRAYFNFIHQDDVFNFTERFDGYVFLDKQGNEYPAIVEFSPYQKIPKNNGGDQRPDAKCNTLESDKEYLAFLEAYENKENENATHPTPEQYLEEIENRDKNKETSTPLLEFLAQRKVNKKGKFRERKSRRQRMAESGHKHEKAWREKNNETKEPSELGEETERKKKRNDEERRNRRNREDKKHASESKDERKNVSEDIGPGERTRRHNNREDKKNVASESKEDSSTRKKYHNNDDPDRTWGDKEEPSPQGKEKPQSKRFSERRRGERSRNKHKDSDSFNQQTVTLLKKDDFPAIGSSAKEGEAETPSPSSTKAKSSKKNADRNFDRIKNKERPAIQIYRPGMGKFSSQTIKAESLKEEHDDSHESGNKNPIKSKTFYRSNDGRSRRAERMDNAD